MSEEFYLLDGVFGKHDTLAQPENVVRTVAQTWSEPQKAQARSNIGAAAAPRADIHQTGDFQRVH